MFELKVVVAVIAWLVSWGLAFAELLSVEVKGGEADYTIPVIVLIVAFVASTLAVTDEGVR